MRAARDERRLAAIGDVLSDLGDRASHAEVARRTGIPIGFLEWAYPKLGELTVAPHSQEAAWRK
ncbi:hypothetical protein JCM18899A_22090 [Nocardioides sp. AN3]